MADEFQPNFKVTRLYGENAAGLPVTKVGILPFVIASRRYGGGALRDDPAGESARSADGGSVPPIIEFLFMKPSAAAKHLGAPTFQIAKGTRRINVSGHWCDMREDDLRFADESFHETLMNTALREGREEIGLKASNISHLFDVGGFTFISATKGIRKPIHIFAAQVLDKADFGEFEATTAEVRWMTVEAFAAEGRADHAVIVKAVSERLAAQGEKM